MYSALEVRKRTKQTLKKAGDWQQKLKHQKKLTPCKHPQKRILRKAPKPRNIKKNAQKNKNNETKNKPKKQTKHCHV